jgi:hypothetical protein
MNMDEVNEIKAQLQQLRTQTVQLNKQLVGAGLRALGLKVGDRIMVTKKDVQFWVEVTGCNTAVNPRPEGVKVKTDGCAGMQGAGFIDQWRKVPQAAVDIEGAAV